MTFFKVVVCGSVLLLFSVSAQAQGNGYYGAGALAQLNADTELEGSPSFTAHVINLMLGYRYSNSLSAEARYGFGVNSSSDNCVNFKLTMQPVFWLSLVFSLKMPFNQKG